MIKSFTKGDFSILLSNFFDHFDSALYGFLVPIIAPIFFPTYDQITQIILAYAILTTSLFTRPIGSLIFGALVKKYNEIYIMFYTLFGISVGSIIFGMIPGYNEIGLKAPLLLLMVRFIKGIFSAGENMIIKLYIMENKDFHKAFKASYIFQATSISGVIVASAVSSLVLLSDSLFLWRLCFILSGLIGFVALSLRSIGFESWQRKSRDSKKQSINLWQARYKLLAIALSTGLSHITYAIPCIVMNNLVPLVTDISLKTMMQLNIFLLILDMLLILVIGPIIKNFDHIKIMSYSAIAMGITTPLLISFLPESGIIYITFVRIWIILLGVIFMSPQNVFFKQLLENAKSQYMLTGLTSAIGAGIIGKTTPVLIFWLYKVNGNLIYPGIFVGVISIITAGSIILVTKQRTN